MTYNNKILLLLMFCPLMIFAPTNRTKPNNNKPNHNKPNWSNPRESSIHIKSRHFKIELYGLKCADHNRIINLISQNENQSDEELKLILLNTKYFKEVSVDKKGNSIRIRVSEHPILRNISMKVSGGNKIVEKMIPMLTDLKKRDHLSPDKIKFATEAIRFYYTNQYKDSNIDVEVFERVKNGAADLKFVIGIRHGPKIRDVQFIGNHKLSSFMLKKQIHHSKTTMHPLPILSFNAISRDELEQSKKNIQSFSKSLGYLDCEVKSITIEEQGKYKYLVVCIHEGKQYKVNKVNIENNCPDMDSETIQDVVLIRPGAVFNQILCDKTQYRIINELSKRQIYTHTVTQNVEQDKSTGTIIATFKIEKIENPIKIGKVIIKGNEKTKDSVILKAINLKPGNLLSQACVVQSRNELMATEFFSEVKINPINSHLNSSGNGVQDIVIEVVEAKTASASGSISNSGENLGVNAQVTETNLLGTGINFDISANISSGPMVITRLTNPNYIGNVGVFIEFMYLQKRINNAGFFESPNLIDMIQDFIFKTEYPTMPKLVKNMSTRNQLKQDQSLKEHVLPYKVAGTKWSENIPLNLNELKCAFKVGAILPVDENHKFTASFSLAKRDIDYGTGLSSESVSREIRKGVRSKYERYQDSYVRTYEQYDVNNTSNYKQEKSLFNKKTGNIVLRNNELSERDKEDFKNSPTIKRFSMGTGMSRALEPFIREKIEFSPSLEYLYIKSLEEHDILLKLQASLTLILGTTTAARLQLGAVLSKVLSDRLTLITEAKFGKSFNQCYLDNFTSADLGLCQVTGPVDLYRAFTLGGSLMFKCSAALYYELYSSNLVQFKPYLKVSLGSLWDSGITPMRMPADLLEARKWPKDTIDIAQNDCNIVCIASPGVSVKFGPIALSVGFNMKVHDNNPDFNVVRGLDFSIGLAT